MKIKCKNCGGEKFTFSTELNLLLNVRFNLDAKINGDKKEAILSHGFLAPQRVKFFIEKIYCLNCHTENDINDNITIFQEKLVEISSLNFFVDIPEISIPEIKIPVKTEIVKTERKIVENKAALEWLNKTIKLLKKVGIKIHSYVECILSCKEQEIPPTLQNHNIRCFYWGNAINFVEPDNVKKVANIWLYPNKKIEWEPDCMWQIKHYSNDDYWQKKVKDLLINFAKNGRLVPGFTLEDGYEGFIKNIETAEEAVEEIKILLRRKNDMEKDLEVKMVWVQ